jgi:hypothetical protein
MSVIGVFVIVFFFLAVVVGPLLAIEDRPGFKRPNEKPRPMVGGHWSGSPFR